MKTVTGFGASANYVNSMTVPLYNEQDHPYSNVLRFRQLLNNGDYLKNILDNIEAGAYDLTLGSLNVSGNVTLGNAPGDTLDVYAAATFNAAETHNGDEIHHGNSYHDGDLSVAAGHDISNFELITTTGNRAWDCANSLVVAMATAGHAVVMLAPGGHVNVRKFIKCAANATNSCQIVDAYSNISMYTLTAGQSCWIVSDGTRWV
jgi:hypothetical protein